MATPRYRDDIKGEVAVHKAECFASMRGELQTTDEFLLLAEDTAAWDEYKDYLTEAEMRSAFKSALRTRYSVAA